MPRTARIDFPGALHHIIDRGLNRRAIFLNDGDRNLFLDRLGLILKSTGTACYAWALMPNHFHLLLATASVPISTVMQRLLTGYAINFNKRHGRCGHLFQNRFRSILCQEDAYLLELVRYIHLNPLRGGLVNSPGELHHYPYCGHGAILGLYAHHWQSTRKVQRLFHYEQSAAQKQYRLFVNAGLAKGKRTDLVEGNLVRRNGEWSAVKLIDGSASSSVGCERILGDDTFIDGILTRLNEVRAHTHRLTTQVYELEAAVKKVATWLRLDTEDIFSRSRGRPITQARSLLCYLVTNEIGVSQARLARDMGITQSAVSQAAKRGRELAKKGRYSLLT
jgi:putative transposase